MCTVRVLLASQDIAPRIAPVLCAAWICQTSAQQVRRKFLLTEVRIQDTGVGSEAKPGEQVEKRLICALILQETIMSILRI